MTSREKQYRNRFVWFSLGFVGSMGAYVAFYAWLFNSDVELAPILRFLVALAFLAAALYGFLPYATRNFLNWRTEVQFRREVQKELLDYKRDSE